MTKYTLLLTLAGLLFTVTNLLPISAAPSAFFLLISGLVFFARTPLPEITLWALAYYGISLISLLFYDPAALGIYDFYRYDGNFILSFAPLLVLPLIRTRWDASAILPAFLLAATAINVATEAIKAAASMNLATGLFVATNAFGGFLMFTNAIAFVWWRQNRTLTALAIFLANLLLMAASYSRGSMLGLAAGLLCYWFIERRQGHFVALMIGGIVAIEIGILCYTYPIYLQTRNVMTVIAQYSDSEKGENIAWRAFENWPRGLYAFFHSPLLGAGFGSVNDMPLTFDKDFALFQFNRGPHIYSSAHAHNTYIHILGEQGVLGLLIFLGLWRAVYRFIRDHHDLPLVRAVLMISFWSLTFASFTEHRIPTPSNTFPFTLTLLLYFAYVAAKKEAGLTEPAEYGIA